jgi:hypothetical protein
MATGEVTGHSIARISSHALLLHRVTAMIVILGGMTIVAGTLMPWMTLLAGLQTFRGILGLYGRLIAGGGAVATGFGLALAVKDRPALRWAAVALGAVIFFFSALLLRNLTGVVGHLRGDPMMVAAPGQGLYVCLIGAAILCGSSATFSRKKRPVFS